MTTVDGSTQIASSLVGTETILVVDDEEALREVTRTDAHSQRLHVRHGLERCSGDSDRGVPRRAHRLVLTDVIMPKMQGPTVAKEVRKLRPDIRVLFMSGHAQPVLEAEAVLGTEFLLLEKPFDQAILLESVRKVLDRDE